MKPAAIYQFIVERQLVFPLVLILLNLASAAHAFAAGDWRKAVYFFASAICLLMASL
jgi:hypothetical protein